MDKEQLWERRRQACRHFLTQALATFLAENTRAAGHRTDAEISLQLRDLIQEFYPLDDAMLERLEECRTEYRTRETYEVQPDVSEGPQSPSGYHLALLDPAFLGGMHPEEDPDMVAAQQRHASKYFRGMANLVAIELVLGQKRFAAVEENLFPAVGTSYAALGYDLAGLTWWVDVAKEWQGFAHLALAG